MLSERYRPTDWTDFIGQDKAVTRVKAILGLPSFDRGAFLLTGASGSGKTSMARVVARHLGCDNWATHEIKGQDCSVDSLRKLATDFTYMPLTGTWKVAIVNECHSMSANLNGLLQSKIINGWPLFWLISLPISTACVIAMVQRDLANAEAVSSMIQLSVRCAVPLLFIAFAASSVHTVFPGRCSRWLFRNRRIIGLSFAAAMAWQGFFILWLVGIHTQYYIEDVYVLSDVVEGVVGYILLLTMVLTSFNFGRRRLSAGQWKLVHKLGIYWLWAYAWSVYWWNIFYYQTPVTLDYIYYWCGYLAWGLRLFAWSKKRWQQAAQSSPVTGVNRPGLAGDSTEQHHPDFGLSNTAMSQHSSYRTVRHARHDAAERH